MKNNIKVERAKKNITQAQLAELVKVSRQTINAIELRKYNLSTKLALKIAHVFNCSVHDIFELEESDWCPNMATNLNVQKSQQNAPRDLENCS